MFTIEESASLGWSPMDGKASMEGLLDIFKKKPKTKEHGAEELELDKDVIGLIDKTIGNEEWVDEYWKDGVKTIATKDPYLYVVDDKNLGVVDLVKYVSSKIIPYTIRYMKEFYEFEKEAQRRIEKIEDYIMSKSAEDSDEVTEFIKRECDSWWKYKSPIEKLGGCKATAPANLKLANNKGAAYISGKEPRNAPKEVKAPSKGDVLRIAAFIKETFKQEKYLNTWASLHVADHSDGSPFQRHFRENFDYDDQKELFDRAFDYRNLEEENQIGEWYDHYEFCSEIIYILRDCFVTKTIEVK